MWTVINILQEAINSGTGEDRMTSDWKGLHRGFWNKMALQAWVRGAPERWRKGMERQGKVNSVIEGVVADRDQHA